MMAKFFFWKPGNHIQKSMIGLQRALPHDILQLWRSPELVRQILPNAWAFARTAPPQVQTRPDISEEDILGAFSLLFQKLHTEKTHRICLFIDALDEFEDNQHMYDSRDLVMELKT